MFAIAYYLLRDGRRLSSWIVQFGDKRGVFEAYVDAVDRDLESIFFGNILHAILTAALAAISYSLLNFFAPQALEIPYPALLGLLTGVASLIPVVGMKLVYVPITGYLGARAAIVGTGYGFPILFFVVAFVGVDSIADFLLRPYVSGRDLHIGLVMFAYILGPLLFGWYGIFLGPVVLVVVYHFAQIVVPELLTGEPIRPVAVDPGHLTNPMSTPPPSETDRSVSDGGEPADEKENPTGQDS
jgi:predicted PurR-regulated permease PerM